MTTRASSQSLRALSAHDLCEVPLLLLAVPIVLRDKAAMLLEPCRWLPLHQHCLVLRRHPISLSCLNDSLGQGLEGKVTFLFGSMELWHDARVRRASGLDEASRGS